MLPDAIRRSWREQLCVRLVEGDLRDAKPYQISQYLDMVRELGLDNRAPTIIPKYHINLFWSESDGAWVADVPDLQPRSAFGETPAEALAETEQAIEAWLALACEDGLLVPEPRYRAPTRVGG
jgi:predicted RNase H-like HicB family nuclease